MIKKCVCFIIIFSMIFLPHPNFVEAQSIDDGPRIESVRGTVFVQRVGGHSLVPVHRGMNVYDGDVIITGMDSTATIIYYEQMIIMGELTTLSVNSIWQRHGRNDSTISLVEGMIKVRVDMQLGDSSRNMVQAAGTIVGVRGTKYILTYRRMIFGDDGTGIGNPFVRMLVIDGEVVVDLPDPDNLGDVATFVVTPQGMQRVSEDIQGRQVHGEVEAIPEIFAVPLESLDLIILEAIRDDARVLEQNPELFDRIEEAIELRTIEDEIRRQTLQERPPPQIITSSEAEDILPTLPTPGTGSESSPPPGTGTGTEPSPPPGTGTGTEPSPPPGTGTGTEPSPPPGTGAGTEPSQPPGTGAGTEPPPPPGTGVGTEPPPPPGTGTPPPGTGTTPPPGTGTPPPPNPGTGSGTTSGSDTSNGNGNDSGGDHTQPPVLATNNVTFNFNFVGAPANAARTVNNGQPVTNPPTLPTRTGFTFAGWFNTSLASGGTEFVTGVNGTAVVVNRTVYARWLPDTPATHTVTFNFNFGGAPANEVRTVNTGQPVLTPPTHNRSGYTFAGWFDTNAASGGIEFETGASGTAVTADRTVYARWTPITHTVTFNFNFSGAPANETRTVNTGQPVLTPPTHNRSGYTFAGWFDTNAASGGTEFETGASGTAVTADRTVYARWTPITHTVTFNFNFSGAPANETRTVNTGQPVLTPPTHNRSGYTFAGWFDTNAASGGTEFETGASGTAVTADRTVYARWASSSSVEILNPLHPANRALIPITTPAVGGDAHFNSTLSFIVRVNGFANEAESAGVGLDITPITGLTFNSTPNSVPFANGTKTFSLDVIYNGTEAFSTAAANIVVGLTGLPGGHGLIGETGSYTVTIRDGQAAGARAIPLTQANIMSFNASLNNDASATGLRSRHFVLHENITLTQSWATIPTFSGEIYGAQHTISDITIQVVGNNDRGMFGTIQSGGRIAHLGLVNLNIPHTITGGGFAAVNSGTITNSFVNGGTISGGGGSDVGGLVGINSGTITNSFANINITGAGTNIGGIVGVNSGNLTNSVSLSQNLVAGSSNTGRIVANNSGNVNNNFGRSDISMGRPPNDITRDGTSINLGNRDDVQLMLNANHGSNAPNLTGILGLSIALPIIDFPELNLDLDLKEEEFPDNQDDEEDEDDENPEDPDYNEDEDEPSNNGYYYYSYSYNGYYYGYYGNPPDSDSDSGNGQ